MKGSLLSFFCPHLVVGFDSVFLISKLYSARNLMIKGPKKGIVKLISLVSLFDQAAVLKFISFSSLNIKGYRIQPCLSREV